MRACVCACSPFTSLALSQHFLCRFSLSLSLSLCPSVCFSLPVCPSLSLSLSLSSLSLSHLPPFSSPSLSFSRAHACANTSVHAHQPCNSVVECYCVSSVFVSKLLVLAKYYPRILTPIDLCNDTFLLSVCQSVQSNQFTPATVRSTTLTNAYLLSPFPLIVMWGPRPNVSSKSNSDWGRFSPKFSTDFCNIAYIANNNNSSSSSSNKNSIKTHVIEVPFSL